jgi:hypothetical protein
MWIAMDETRETTVAAVAVHRLCVEAEVTPPNYSGVLLLALAELKRWMLTVTNFQRLNSKHCASPPPRSVGQPALASVTPDLPTDMAP